MLISVTVEEVTCLLTLPDADADPDPPRMLKPAEADVSTVLEYEVETLRLQPVLSV